MSGALPPLSMDTALPTLVGMIGLAGAVATGAIFLSGVAPKVRNRAEFHGIVDNYRILPAVLVAPAAVALPWIELAVGAGLLAGLRIAAVPAMALLTIFAAAIGINLARGRAAIDCGCGSRSDRHTLHRGMVWRNLALTGLLGLRLVPVPLADTAVAASIATGLAILILIHLQDAVVLLARSPLASARGH